MLAKNKCLSLLSALICSTFLISSCASSYKQESTGEYLDSSVITAEVKTRILADEEVNSLPISVKTYKNTVQLSGFVNNEHQKAKAESIAKSVKGVQYVQDSLMIKTR